MEQKPFKKKADYSRSLILYTMFIKHHEEKPMLSASVAFIDFFASFKSYRDIDEAIDKTIADEKEFEKAITSLLIMVREIVVRQEKKD